MQVLRSTALVALLVFSAIGGSAYAKNDKSLNCTPITSLPATIGAPGVYCLAANLTTAQTAGAAIEINASNVHLDLNGYTIQGTAGNAAVVLGVWGAGTAENVRVMNGVVRGFHTGVFLIGAGGTVQGIIADHNFAAGIYVEGRASRVRENQVRDTGPFTGQQDSAVVGIVVNGPETLVEDNHVSGLTPRGIGEALGISFNISAPRSTARNNVVSNSARPSAASYGIEAPASDIAVINNVVTNFTFCVSYAYNSYVGTGIYSRNMAVNCDTKYRGGTPGTGND